MWTTQIVHTVLNLLASFYEFNENHSGAHKNMFARLQNNWVLYREFCHFLIILSKPCVRLLIMQPAWVTVIKTQTPANEFTALDYANLMDSKGYMILKDGRSSDAGLVWCIDTQNWFCRPVFRQLTAQWLVNVPHVCVEIEAASVGLQE